MYTVKCTGCGFGNVIDEKNCMKCGGSLFEANLLHHTEQLRNLNATMQQRAYPKFYTFNGCGTTLIDYRELSDGIWTATRWVTIIGLPIIPLSEYVIKPFHSATDSNAHRFEIIRTERPSIVRILMTYALAVSGPLPLILGFLNQSWVNRTLGGPKAALAMFLCFGWFIFVLTRFMGSDKAFKKAKSN
ncbi:MAG: hypothetical protein ABIP75_03565 [Pyrinomonadaceae bacterium]